MKIMKIPITKNQIPGPDRVNATVVVSATVSLKRTMIYIYQVAPGRAQTNPNDPNSKFQTNELSTVVPSVIITGRPRFAKRCGTTVVSVLVIEY
jgi:hypothetical protein